MSLSSSSPDLSIVMPVFDEAPTVERALDAVLGVDLGLGFELIVVDDGSTDGTQRILRERDWKEPARLLTHDRNRGKGAAVRTGIASARGTVTTIFDADLEYDPADLALVAAPVLAGETNAVFGVRAFEGHTSHSFLYVMGNRAVTLTANLLFNVYLGDLMTCHKAVRTDVLQNLSLTGTGFEIEAEIAAQLVLHGERIYEIPVSYSARATDEGKKLTAKDGVRVLRTLLRCRFSRTHSRPS